MGAFALVLSEDKEIRASDFSTHLFWDVRVEEVCLKKHRVFVIERVLSKGTWSDFLLLKQVYGKAKIRNTVKKLRYLDTRVLHFCGVYFNVPIEKFRCYSLQQSKQTHWHY